MLLEYSVSNIKSIMREENISLIAHPFKNQKSQNIHLLNGNVLPYIAFYGPNGGGKSSFLESIGILLNLIFTDKSKITDTINYIQYVKYKSNHDEPTIWKIKVQDKHSKIYAYTISVTDRIVHEKLSILKSVNSTKEDIIFEIKDNKVVFLDKCLETHRDNLTNKTIPIVNFLYNIDATEFINQFMSELNLISVLDSSAIPSTINSTSGSILENPIYMTDIIKNKNTYLKIFSDIDLNIVDVKMERTTTGERFILTKQAAFGKTYDIDFWQESSGTRKVIKLLSILVNKIENQGVAIIDELDCQLHPLLLGYIIKMFANKNNNGAQIIFSTHNITTMTSDYFRKDQIYFAALNELFFTNIICLNNFGSMIRENNSFAKKYLEGSIGYDPYINLGMEWMNDKKQI